jgi:hypothetical protein
VLAPREHRQGKQLIAIIAAHGTFSRAFRMASLETSSCRGLASLAAELNIVGQSENEPARIQHLCDTSRRRISLAKSAGDRAAAAP